MDLSTSPKVPTIACEPDAAVQAELKAARAEISFLRSMDEEMHGLIGGSFEASLAAAEAKRDAILARQGPTTEGAGLC